jgi:integrase
MGSVKIPNVSVKNGRTYYRKKEGGKDYYLRLPPIDSPGFAEAYQKAKGRADREIPHAGTMAALVAEYRASAEFKNIPSDNTRRNYERYLDMLATKHGKNMVRDMSHADVLRERDKMAETPGKANNWVARLNTLMKFAIRRGYRNSNPAAEIKPLPIGEHEPWPANVLNVALEKATPMTRLAIVTGLCTGARIGDAIKLRHDWHDGEMMEFRSSKKKIDVAVPMHPLLLDELAKHPRKAVTLLYDRQGKPFKDTKALQERIRDLMKSIGHPGYTFHGLRKNAACYLSELGLSDREIGSILAMDTDTVRHYTKRSRALMVARGVAERIKKGDVISFAGGRGK